MVGKPFTCKLVATGNEADLMPVFEIARKTRKVEM